MEYVFVISGDDRHRIVWVNWFDVHKSWIVVFNTMICTGRDLSSAQVVLWRWIIVRLRNTENVKILGKSYSHTWNKEVNSVAIHGGAVSFDDHCQVIFWCGTFWSPWSCKILVLIFAIETFPLPPWFSVANKKKTSIRRRNFIGIWLNVSIGLEKIFSSRFYLVFFDQTLQNLKIFN